MSRTLLRFHGVAFAYPGWQSVLLEDMSFAVREGERVGILGFNGTGKTTLLGLISGKLEPTAGRIERAGADCFHFEQEDCASGGASVLEYFLDARPRLRTLTRDIAQAEMTGVPDPLSYAAWVDEFGRLGGYDVHRRIGAVIASFGFDPTIRDRPVDSFSGGERRLLRLAAGLIEDKSLYLLDEPTNYLDDAGIAFLVRGIGASRQAFVIVSHDRWFLDATVGRIFEIEQRTMREYRGNYSAFYARKTNEMLARLRKQERIESQIAKLKTVERTYKCWGQRKEKEVKSAGDRGFVSHRAAKLMKRAIQAKERVGKKIKDLQATKPYIKKYYPFRFEAAEVGTGGCLACHGLARCVNGRALFSDLGFTMDWGERVAITGPNGSGKTTLVKILLGEISADAGAITWARQRRIGYLPQQPDPALADRVVHECFHDDEREQAQTLLGVLKVMCRGDIMGKTLGGLSEGQQRKIALVRLILARPNILVLDEPTTHLDYQTCEYLEAALLGFRGSVLLVTHDRILRQRVADRCVDLGSFAY